MLTSITQIFLIAALLVLTAFFLLRQYLSWFRYAHACKKWPHVTGRITAAPDPEDSGSSFSRPGPGRGMPEIRYSYFVDGKEYEGNNVSFDPEIRRNAALLRRISEHFEVSEEVAVYYNPKNPDVSVLKQ
jgi:Protein of unknown function (DUF3592)